MAYGLGNVVDLLSSIVVLWRFYCPGELTHEKEKLLQKREERASMAISFIAVLLGVATITASIGDFKTGAEDPYALQELAAISLASFVVFGTLMTLKFHYAAKLQSPSLYKDALCSLLGCFLSASIFINSSIIEEHASWWKLEPLVAFICGIAALLLGFYWIIHASCVQGLPIFRCIWWIESEGDGMDEMGAPELAPADFGKELELSKQEGDVKTELSSIV